MLDKAIRDGIDCLHGQRMRKSSRKCVEALVRTSWPRHPGTNREQYLRCVRVREAARSGIKLRLMQPFRMWSADDRVNGAHNDGIVDHGAYEPERLISGNWVTRGI